MVVNKDKLREIELIRKKFVYSNFLECFLVDFVADLTNNATIEYYSNREIDVEQPIYSQLIEKYAFKLVNAEDTDSFIRFFDKDKLIASYKNNIDKNIHEFRYQAGNGETKWCKATVNLYSKENNVFCYTFIEDINDFKNWQSEIIFKSEHDSLTELKNRLATEASVNKYIREHDGSGMHAFFIFDIDNFKNINNSFGHIFGDVFLVQTAKKTKKLFRQDDIVGRIGGDEFVIFMKNITTKDSAFKKAEAIIKSIESKFVAHGQTFHATVSVGISFCENEVRSYQELLSEADTAMYYCKNSGKNKYLAFAEGMDFATIYKVNNAADTDAYIPSYEYDASEYIYRVLRDNVGVSGFNIALELVGRYFNVCHSAIYNLNTKSFPFIYSKENAKLNSDKLMKNFEVTKDYLRYYNDGMFYYIIDGSINDELLNKYFADASCNSAIHFSIMDKGQLIAILSFSRCNSVHPFTQKEATLLRNIANYISIFYLNWSKTH